ncbi:MAG: TIGR04348 family glycosyltransferase [Planctomycetes bacterium]|nr:TIGR04348 family glycosyltransferase [Planctomycetota bacterium]
MNTTGHAIGSRVVIVTPAPRGSTSGNRVTALRWAALLRQLGVQVQVHERWQGQACDVLVAVHAAKSAPSVLRIAAERPAARRVVLLAGTDIYPQFTAEPDALAALQLADAVIGLQPLAAAALPAALRGKVRTIVQSAVPVPATRRATFRVCVLAHLREVKAPLLPLLAFAQVPYDRPAELVLAGRALTAEVETRLQESIAHEPRARWLGPLPRQQARRLLGESHACIVASTAEGGANVVTEAIAAGTPVLASDIPGNRGLLGADWPATFPPGDAEALGRLLVRCRDDEPFRRDLERRLHGLLPMVDPAHEREAWRRLLTDLGVGLPPVAH